MVPTPSVVVNRWRELRLRQEGFEPLLKLQYLQLLVRPASAWVPPHAAPQLVGSDRRLSRRAPPVL
jgi:hypothetical protein